MNEPQTDNTATREAKVARHFDNKQTRPLSFGELHLILTRFKIMLEEEPDRYSVAEFIQQENYRRELFSDSTLAV